jgi:branched-chain amino acid transport system substrate-binding protein
MALLLLGAVSFALPVWAAESVVRVGNIEPLSGPSAAVGQQGKFARDMAGRSWK